MSRRALAVILTAGLIAGLMAAPADAQRRKKKPKPPKPIEVTLFMEGTETFGEMESFSLLADGFLALSAEEPEGGEKSKQIVNYVGGPNTACAGNTFWPVFVGEFTGHIKGDITVTFDVTSSPGASAELWFWPDVNSTLCNDDFPEPAASVEVDLPAGRGTVEAVIEDADFEADSVLMFQVTPVLVPPFFGRMHYGTEGSMIELTCIPAKRGGSCTP